SALARRPTISRLGEARPSSRKLRWRCETSVRPARSSCESPRCSRHHRSRAAKLPSFVMNTSEVVAARSAAAIMPRVARALAIRKTDFMPDMLGPLVLFAAVMSFTPGPNVIMITASAANFGFARTIPQMLGITLGFAAMILAAGLGLAGLVQAEPRLHA